MGKEEQAQQILAELREVTNACNAIIDCVNQAADARDGAVDDLNALTEKWYGENANIYISKQSDILQSTTGNYNAMCALANQAAHIFVEDCRKRLSDLGINPSKVGL